MSHSDFNIDIFCNTPPPPSINLSSTFCGFLWSWRILKDLQWPELKILKDEDLSMVSKATEDDPENFWRSSPRSSCNKVFMQILKDLQQRKYTDPWKSFTWEQYRLDQTLLSFNFQGAGSFINESMLLHCSWFTHPFFSSERRLLTMVRRRFCRRNTCINNC